MKLPSIPRPLLVDLAGLLAVALAFGFLVWFLLIRPVQKANEAARAKGVGIVAEGERAKAADAVPIIERHFTERERIERVTVQGNAAIAAAEGASERIPAAVDLAGRRALCLHQIYANSPACQQLPHADSGNSQSPNPGR